MFADGGRERGINYKLNKEKRGWKGGREVGREHRTKEKKEGGRQGWDLLGPLMIT